MSKGHCASTNSATPEGWRQLAASGASGAAVRPATPSPRPPYHAASNGLPTQYASTGPLGKGRHDGNQVCRRRNSYPAQQFSQRLEDHSANGCNYRRHNCRSHRRNCHQRHWYAQQRDLAKVGGDQRPRRQRGRRRHHRQRCGPSPTAAPAILPTGNAIRRNCRPRRSGPAQSAHGGKAKLKTDLANEIGRRGGHQKRQPGQGQAARWTGGPEPVQQGRLFPLLLPAALRARPPRPGRRSQITAAATARYVGRCRPSSKDPAPTATASRTPTCRPEIASRCAAPVPRNRSTSSVGSDSRLPRQKSLPQRRLRVRA